MTNVRKENLELDAQQLEEVTGGDYETAYTVAVELAKYTDALMAKYNCNSFNKLMKMCTPEEKDRMRQLRNAMWAQVP